MSILATTEAMSSLGLEGKEVENLFRRFDPDKSGFLDKQDWASRPFREYNLQLIIYEYDYESELI